MKRILFFIPILFLISHLAAETNGPVIDHYKAGMTAVNRGEPEKAVNELILALKDNYQNFAAYYYLGMCYRITAKYDKALFTFQRALELKDKDEGLMPALYNEMMMVYYFKDDCADSERTGLRALKSGYKSAGILNEMARAYLCLGKTIQSRKAAELALDLDPANPWSYNMLGLVYLETGEYTKAVTACQTAIAFRGDVSWFYSNLALAFEKLERYREAYENYQKALELSPGSRDNADAVARVKKLIPPQRKNK